MPKKVPPGAKPRAAPSAGLLLAGAAKLTGRTTTTTTTKAVPQSLAKVAARSNVETVVLQARVDAQFARTLLDEDAAVLGLDGASAVVREGLRLLHRHAQEQAAAAAYNAFYGGAVAPLPAGTASAEAD